MKKVQFSIFILIITLITVPLINPSNQYVYAEINESIFTIYNKHNEPINTSQNCEIGDMFISADNELYEVIAIDNETCTALAIKKSNITLPEVTKVNSFFVSTAPIDKRVAIYTTHNAESYVIGDGYDSVYGQGGIMDIAVSVAEKFELYNTSVNRSVALHLPHDTNAYARSSETAKSLLKTGKVDAIFDIHRDGVSRSQYITTLDGVEASKVRIVVGKANSNYLTNLDFALAIKAYADNYHKNMIKDIYLAKGHYNQALHERALLFEMGTYLIEKDYVKRSITPLVDSIEKVLYSTAVAGTNGSSSYGEQAGTIPDDNLLDNDNNNYNNDNTTYDTTNEDINWGTILAIIGGIVIFYVIVVVFYRKRAKTK